MWWAKEKALTRVLQVSAFYVVYRPTTSDRPERCCQCFSASFLASSKVEKEPTRVHHPPL